MDIVLTEQAAASKMRNISSGFSGSSGSLWEMLGAGVDYLNSAEDSSSQE
jgi:hypothetical protein